MEKNALSSNIAKHYKKKKFNYSFSIILNASYITTNEFYQNYFCRNFQRLNSRALKAERVRASNPKVLTCPVSTLLTKEPLMGKSKQ